MQEPLMSAVTDDTNSCSQVAGKRIFQLRWLKMYPWLLFNAETKRMFCQLCQQAKKKNVFAIGGAGTIMLSTITKHQGTADHSAASESDLMRKSLYRTEIQLAPAANPSEPDTDCISPSDKCLFSTVYYAGKKGIANDTVNSLLNLQRFNAVDCKYVDLHSSSILSVQESIVAVLDCQMADRRKHSNYFGILIDESTDVAVHKSMVMYLRYVYIGNMMTEFVGNIRVSDGKAETLVHAIEDKLSQLQIDCNKVVGLASDGASVMIGRKTGVGAMLAAKCPGLVQVHCVAHRLNLSCVDALKEHPYLKQLRDKVNSLFSYFSKSSIRCDKLKLFQEAIGEQPVKLKHAIEIRWLAMYGAVAAIHMSYGALVATLTDDLNNTASVKATAALEFMTDYKFPAAIALLTDALKVVTDLSKKFQEDNIDLSSVKPNVDIAIGKLQAMQQHPGSCLAEFFEKVEFDEDDQDHCSYRGVSLSCTMEQVEDFQLLKTNYINGVIEAIKDRFENESTHILNCFLLIEPTSTCSNECYSNCLEVIADKYGFAIEAASLQSELVAVTALKTGCYKGYSLKQFARVILSRHATELPETAKLCEIALCIPVSTAVCERGFSRQNFLKNNLRNALNESNLENLMKICNGPEIDLFPFTAAVKHWYEQKRQQARLFTQSTTK